MVLGIPFLRAVSSAIFLDAEGRDSMVLQQLGAAFRIDYRIPQCSDDVPTTDIHSQAVYPALVDTSDVPIRGYEPQTRYGLAPKVEELISTISEFFGVINVLLVDKRHNEGRRAT